MSIHEVFDKDQEKTPLRWETLPFNRGAANVAELKEEVFHFGIARPVYAVYLDGVDVEKTRFFITRAGADAYMDLLLCRLVQKPQDLDAKWGWKSIREMKAHFNRHVM